MQLHFHFEQLLRAIAFSAHCVQVLEQFENFFLWILGFSVNKIYFQLLMNYQDVCVIPPTQPFVFIYLDFLISTLVGTLQWICRA